MQENFGKNKSDLEGERMKKLYKATELAKIMQVNPRTIYRLAEQGQIESYRIGKSIRFTMPNKESEGKTK